MVSSLIAIEVEDSTLMNNYAHFCFKVKSKAHISINIAQNNVANNVGIPHEMPDNLRGLLVDQGR